MWPTIEFSPEVGEGFAGIAGEIASRDATDSQFYPELFPELEAASAGSQPALRNVGMPFQASRFAQRVLPTAASGCLLPRDSEILDFFQRKTDVLGLVLVPQARLANRAAVSVNQPANIPIPSPDMNAVKRLSAVQLQLFRESFPVPGGGLGIDAICRAFYDFANGDLRTPEIGPNLGVGEPDSSAFFLFAEFAFLCIGKGIDAQEWAQILPCFVSAQEISIYAYRKKPHAVPPAVNAPLPPVCSPLRHPLSTYDHKNFDGRDQSSEQRKADLLGKYSGVSLAQIRAAANENLRHAQCAP